MPEAYFPAKTLFFGVNDAFSLAASDVFPFSIGFDIAGENGELRNSLKLLSFPLFLFTFNLNTHSLLFFQTFP